MSSNECSDWDSVIDSPTYIVLDIPSPMAEKIQDFRRKFDPERAALPAEITLTGSCGTGLISSGQTVSRVSALLEKATKKIAPFTVCFDRVDRFPNTDIYFLSLKDSPELSEAQKIVSWCGIKFDPVAYPFHPHCTLSLRKALQCEQKLLDLFFLDVPQEPFLLDMLSVYALHGSNVCEILCKQPLLGKQSPI